MLIIHFALLNLLPLEDLQKGSKDFQSIWDASQCYSRIIAAGLHFVSADINKSEEENYIPIFDTSEDPSLEQKTLKEALESVGIKRKKNQLNREETHTSGLKFTKTPERVQKHNPSKPSWTVTGPSYRSKQTMGKGESQTKTLQGKAEEAQRPNKNHTIQYDLVEQNTEKVLIKNFTNSKQRTESIRLTH